MTLGDGFPAASGTVDSTELRKALAGLILRDTSGVPRAGIFPRHTSALVTAKASMAVDVAAFEGVTVRGGGVIFMANDGTVAVTIDAAPGSNSRIDVVYFKQNESASPYSDANNLPVIAVAKGTAGAVPVKPTIPTGAVELATVLIPSGVSATNAGGVVITQTYPYTTTTGGELWVRDATELAALPTYADGTRVRQINTGATATQPSAVFARSTNYTLSTSYQAVPFQSAPRLYGISWAVSPNPSRITIQQAGIYIIGGNIQINSTATAEGYFAVNGAFASAPRSVTNVSGASTFNFNEILELAAGDYVEFMAKSNSTWPYVAGNRMKIARVA